VGNGLDEEALRIIKSTIGLWKPGISQGKPTSVRLSTVITFKLPEQGHSKETEGLPKSVKIQTDDILFENPISNAEYIGGQHLLLSFIAENFQIPESLILEDLDINQIIVMIEVDTLGSVEVIKTLGESSGLGLEQEAVRVIKLTSGKWKPATI